MKITFILKGTLEALPPMFPRIIYFAESGFEVSLICTKMTEKSRRLLEKSGVLCEETCHRRTIFGKHNKLADWMFFKKACKRLVSEKFSDSDYLYVCSADTALAINSVLKGKRYIFQSNELYDRFPVYRNGIKKYARTAVAFVVPEYCRANICMSWYGLKKTPIVVPNIPFVLSREINQEITDEKAKAIIDSISDKRIVLYQGYINSGDRSLSVIAEALKRLNDPELILVLMGTDQNNSVQGLKEIYEHTVYIPFVPAPYHLEITSHAHIALLSYDRVSLNNIFCAPNKIYEYSCFGIPMLGNDIPGLRYTIDYNKMGICAAYENVESVANAIGEISENYDMYSFNSKNFFEKNSLEKSLKDITDKLTAGL